MGACEFSTYADGSDPAQAFADAREQAAYEDGAGGYSGTIAEKDSFTVICRAPVELDQAKALARQLLRQADPRISDKWGPAGAIPVRLATRCIRLNDLAGWLVGDGDQAELDRLAGIARDRGLLAAGEEVTAYRMCEYRVAWLGSGAYTGGTAELTVVKDPAALEAQTHPDGWLFFGYASS